MSTQVAKGLIDLKCSNCGSGNFKYEDISKMYICKFCGNSVIAADVEIDMKDALDEGVIKEADAPEEEGYYDQEADSNDNDTCDGYDTECDVYDTEEDDGSESEDEDEDEAEDSAEEITTAACSSSDSYSGNPSSPFRYVLMLCAGVILMALKFITSNLIGTVASENADMASETSGSLTGIAGSPGLVNDFISTISTASTYIGIIMIALAVFGIVKSVLNSARGY